MHCNKCQVINQTYVRQLEANILLSGESAKARIIRIYWIQTRQTCNNKKQKTISHAISNNAYQIQIDQKITFSGV